MTRSGSQGSDHYPRFLFADTSSLLPLGIGDCFPTVKRLESIYGITTVITENVEMELRYNVSKKPKFQHLKTALSRALATGTIAVLTDALADEWGLGDSVMDDIESEALRFQSFGVGSGESYTHAAAAALGMPALTDDIRAVSALETNGVHITGFLRCFDVIAFAYQSGLLTETECDGVRSSLIRGGETIDRAFRNRSFRDGLGHFYLRLVDRDCDPVGNSAPINQYDRYRLTIARTCS
jgi:hypothetical protein